MSGIKKFYNVFQFGRELRAKSEIQTARMRLVLGSLITIYLFASNVYTAGNTISNFALYCISFYMLTALGIFLLTIRTPGQSPYRPIVGFSLDLGIGTALMVSGGSATAWLYGGFLWTIIAAGIRFGIPYLITATLLAVVGFGITLLLSPFWQANIVMGIGMLAWLLVLPLYIAKLLHNLEKAIEEADVANHAKSRFLANMSHEIRTPLTAIIGYSESALGNDQSMQERTHALSIIMRSGHHLLAIINDILDFSKIEADEMSIEHIDVNPFQILADVEAIAATQAIQKGLQFEVDYQLPLPDGISSDPVRFQQILLNLCSNAVKFTKQGAVTISVQYLKHSNQLQCQVRDTGIGIDAGQLENIFKPFKQADSSTTRHYGGTGLGLSLSKRLAALMGGELTVSSQPAKGTTFTLTIPCGEFKELIYDLDKVDFCRQQAEKPAVVNNLHGTILLAEDNVTNQKLISSLLGKMGAEVTTANNGAEALELALHRQYDLIYMDMQMPVMSGLDAIRQLRANHYRAPIVALTANATREDRNLCMAAGCNDYLTKPVNIDRLQRITARFLHANKNETMDMDVAIEPIHSELLHKDSIVKDLLADFINELSKMITHIKMSFVNENWPDMCATVHDLKGMGGGFGYPQLSQLAEELETELKKENYANVRNLLNQIDVTCQRIHIGNIPNSNCA